MIIFNFLFPPWHREILKRHTGFKSAVELLGNSSHVASNQKVGIEQNREKHRQRNEN